MLMRKIPRATVFPAGLRCVFLVSMTSCLPKVLQMSRAFSDSGTTSGEAEEPITVSEPMPSGRVFSYFELRQLAQKRDACKLVKAE